MIELNATFFVQALHFLAVWWVVDRFFFQEVVAIIQQEQREIELFNQEIEKERELLAKEQDRRAALWIAYQQKFKSTVPRLSSSLIAPSAQLLMCPVCFDLNPEQKEKYIQQTVLLITQRVINE